MHVRACRFARACYVRLRDPQLAYFPSAEGHDLVAVHDQPMPACATLDIMLELMHAILIQWSQVPQKCSAHLSGRSKNSVTHGGTGGVAAGKGSSLTLGRAQRVPKGRNPYIIAWLEHCGENRVLHTY